MRAGCASARATIPRRYARASKRGMPFRQPPTSKCCACGARRSSASARRCSAPPTSPTSARPTGTGASRRRVAELGYAALFIGTLLEGETVVFLAGLAAHHGYLWFPAVLAVSVVGGFLSDQILFHVGRRYGERVYARF